MKITKLQAGRLLNEDMKQAGQVVDQLVKVDLTPAQHHALTSFVFNVGEGAFRRSSVLRHLNNGQLFDASVSLLTYIRNSHGQIMAGLQRRRRDEAKLLLGV